MGQRPYGGGIILWSRLSVYGFWLATSGHSTRSSPLFPGSGHSALDGNSRHYIPGRRVPIPMEWPLNLGAYPAPIIPRPASASQLTAMWFWTTEYFSTDLA